MSREILLLLALLGASVCSLAADLTVVVLDPNGVAISGARVALYPNGSSRLIAIHTTSSDGRATFSDLESRRYSLQVLAPGFSAKSLPVDLAQDSGVTATLSITALPQTVVVSAARTPLPLEETGVSEALLDSDQITNQQPVSASDALRFLPGAIVADSGQRGGISSLFVRGGDSRYNKVIVDGVPVDDPGGTFDFGVVPMNSVDRLEFVRGPESTLYGSDAMTSVIQLWSATGHTRTPELTLASDGGNFSTAHGSAALAGAFHRFDYNLFADQFNTQGSGANDAYSNSLQGANLGLVLTRAVMFRVRTRHTNSRTGVQGEWTFNGARLLPPDLDQRARQNNFLADADLIIAAPSRWQHRFSGYEYNHRRLNVDAVPDRGCDFISVFLDCPFSTPANINRAGFEYQGDYSPRTWAHSTFGYDFEDENGSFNTFFSLSPTIAEHDFTHGLRRSHGLYGQELLTYKRLTLLAGVRYVHNESFGQRVVPHATLTALLFRGNDVFTGTRLHFGYGEGIKEPRFEESFGIAAVSFPIVPNPHLEPEENRSLEAGIEQQFMAGRYAISANYFNNLFRNQIDFETASCFCSGEYINVNKSMAHGAELEFHARPWSQLSFDASYNFVPTEIQREVFDPTQQGKPLLRRPKHSGSLLANYSANRWGAEFGGTFIGRRRDSDFFVAPMPVNHAAGYARFDAGGWRSINHYVTAYANIENLLNKHYEDVVGYPALGINFRAGLRFRIGGD